MFFGKLFGDISFGLPGPLQTAFELQIDLKTATNQPDTTALTEKTINLRILPKINKQKYSKIANLRGLVCSRLGL